MPKRNILFSLSLTAVQCLLDTLLVHCWNRSGHVFSLNVSVPSSLNNPKFGIGTVMLLSALSLSLCSPNIFLFSCSKITADLRVACLQISIKKYRLLPWRLIRLGWSSADTTSRCQGLFRQAGMVFSTFTANYLDWCILIWKFFWLSFVQAVFSLRRVFGCHIMDKWVNRCPDDAWCSKDDLLGTFLAHYFRLFLGILRNSYFALSSEVFLFNFWYLGVFQSVRVGLLLVFFFIKFFDMFFKNRTLLSLI